MPAVACVLFLLTCAMDAAPVQDKPAEQKIDVRVADASGPPDGQVVASVYLTSASGSSVGALDVTIMFAPDLLSFVTAEAGGLADGVGAKVTAKAATDAAQTVVRLTISSIDEGGSRARLPEGSLAHVILKIAKDAKHGTAAPLKVNATARTTDDPPRPVQVAVEDSQVIVAERAVPSCFFYMH